MQRIALVLMICMLFLLGCQSSSNINIHTDNHIVVYKTINNLMEPNYIIFKTKPKISELYFPSQYTSVFGEWSSLKDTIYIKPQYIYDPTSNPILSDVNTVDSSIISISQKYLVKGNILIDVTDYSILHPMLKESRTEFKRVK